MTVYFIVSIYLSMWFIENSECTVSRLVKSVTYMAAILKRQIVLVKYFREIVSSLMKYEIFYTP